MLPVSKLELQPTAVKKMASTGSRKYHDSLPSLILSGEVVLNKFFFKYASKFQRGKARHTEH